MIPSLTQLDGPNAGPFRRLYDGPLPFRDEMVDPEGSLRPHWQTFVHAMDELGFAEVARRWEDARHLIREHGVTYNVYGDPRGLSRPWVLDPIPLLISADDSLALEAGLVQRARLLELILADLYGPQRLLHDGLLPPELVFAHPGFLRPCHGVQPCGGRFLHLYAANLGRTPDGQVWVLADRTQAPSGAGYALENRLVLSRMLPNVFRECQVQRLARFFLTVRETLREIAPHHRDNPRVVLLTPGPYNETYFEHAFLAQYLGYTLVEGGDLTVRGDRVFLKLLGGLQPVDVILSAGRRLLRSAAASARFLPRRAGTGPGSARRQRRRGQLTGQRFGRDAGTHGLSAHVMLRTPWRAAEVSVGSLLVVRRPHGPRARSHEPAAPGDQTVFSLHGRGAGFRRKAQSRPAPEPG